MHIDDQRCRAVDTAKEQEEEEEVGISA